MFTFLLKLKVLDIFIIIWDSLRIFYDKDMRFLCLLIASEGLLYGLCVFRVCV